MGYPCGVGAAQEGPLFYFIGMNAPNDTGVNFVPASSRRTDAEALHKARFASAGTLAFGIKPLSGFRLALRQDSLGSVAL